MKQGKTLSELAVEIERQEKTKKDFIVPVTKLRMDEFARLKIEDDKLPEPLELTEHAHNQIGDYAQIPRKYYDRLREEDATILLAQNVNYGFSRKPNDKKMIRTLDGMNRAFLSDSYRPLDNFDMMHAVLPVLTNSEIQIRSSEITDRRLYLKATFPRIQGEVKKGDVVEAGIVVSNSEVGAGGVHVQPLIYRLSCLNGMIVADSSIKKFHLGKRQGMGDNVEELLSTATKQLSDKAFWMQVRDVVAASMNDIHFRTHLERLQEAAGIPIESKKLDKVVEVATKKMGFGDRISDNIFQHLIQGGDLSQWGLANAFTRTANDEEDYETATALEKAGGELIELSRTDWRQISEAA